MSPRAKAFSLVLLILCTLLLTGCWNRRELSDVAIVSGFGVDWVPDSNRYRLTMQIVNPTAIPSAQSGTGGGGGGGGSQAAPIIVISAEGRTLYEAVREGTKLTTRQLYFAHLRAIVIGETLARRGIEELFDSLVRSDEVRLTSKLYVARGTSAEAVLSMSTVFEQNPAEALVSKMEFTQDIWGESINEEVDDVVRALVSKGSDELALGGIRIMTMQDGNASPVGNNKTRPDAILAAEGIAMFKGDRLQGWLDDEQARGAMWIMNEINNTGIIIGCSSGEGDIAIEVTRSKTSVNPRVEDGQVHFELHIQQEGTLKEVNCAADLNKLEEIRSIEKRWGQETKKQVLQAMKAAQKLESDIFGLGKVVQRKDSAAWSRLQQQWQRKFAQAGMEIKVDASIRQPGMNQNPFLKSRKKQSVEEGGDSGAGEN